MADEVRNLAGKSNESASEIDSVTHTLEIQSKSVEASMQKGVSVLKEAARNISQGMDQIAHMAETNMAAVEAASHAAGELTRLSTNLQSSVSWFKV